MGSLSLSDTPLSESVNDFGVEGYVQGLERFITHAATPITIALQGEWGSGKTSLMNRLYNDLCSDDKPFVGININTWEYSMLASPEETVIKIIGKLVSSLSEHDPQASSKVGQYMRGALNFAWRVGREAMKGIVPGAGLLVEGLDVATELPEGKQTEKAVSLSELKQTLTDAVNKTITDFNKKGILVFVDDLDRLNPPLAVQILELLKNIFTLDNCIFVLAIDYDVVVKGLEPKFGKFNDTNEREFRSFFDKIIQVPFSLPVNNYRPMDFVLRSLFDIGYITDIERSIPMVKNTFAKIVESSVGKNPRSIKRLINTLSLLDCIDICGNNTNNEGLSMDDKFLNFITVAIQICYPKIYKMLSLKPGFTSWDTEFASKMGIKYKSNDSSDEQWEEILECACKTDAFLSKHNEDISQLLNLVIEILGKPNQEDLSKKMKQILDKSSVTGVGAEFKAEDLDKKDLIGKLHTNVIEYIHKKRPDISNIKNRRNTGNGGLYVWYTDEDYFDVTFTPAINAENKIALRLWLDFETKTPERLLNKSFDEIMEEEVIGDAILKLDAVISTLLSKCDWFFKGRTYEENTIFPTYIDELKYLHQNGYISGVITNNPQYWIDLEKPSHFEDRQIISAVGDLIIANYDFRKSLVNWE
jgi:GTPase SAR1 family protein